MCVSACALTWLSCHLHSCTPIYIEILFAEHLFFSISHISFIVPHSLQHSNSLASRRIFNSATSSIANTNRVFSSTYDPCYNTCLYHSSYSLYYTEHSRTDTNLPTLLYVSFFSFISHSYPFLQSRAIHR